MYYNLPTEPGATPRRGGVVVVVEGGVVCVRGCVLGVGGWSGGVGVGARGLYSVTR